MIASVPKRSAQSQTALRENKKKEMYMKMTETGTKGGKSVMKVHKGVLNKQNAITLRTQHKMATPDILLLAQAQNRRVSQAAKVYLGVP